ncbi:testis-expressed protein 36 isoform X2 [Gadus chalcogrammus]|uniref:testis-expressed protein 36 isoform X2 n=1 Tax=Gadus chalcogrammus TaxID=1042646 RepID=UPI0024C47F86|nr:testis-expressed protein 36 isoform X2 [Gadus chalcogrammus]
MMANGMPMTQGSKKRAPSLGPCWGRLYRLGRKNYELNVTSSRKSREAIRDGICLFSQGLGRKKCPDDHRQHNSHFCLCHDDPVAVSWPSTAGDLTAYQTEGLVRKDQAEAVTNRRFPRSHQERSAEAAAAQAREPAFMWFGRHDSEDSVPLGVLAATNCLATRI